MKLRISGKVLSLLALTAGGAFFAGKKILKRSGARPEGSEPQRTRAEADRLVDQMSEESFPASDAPAW